MSHSKLNLLRLPYVTEGTTKILLRTAFVSALLFGILLVIYDAINSQWMSQRMWVLLTFLTYLIISEILYSKGHQRLVNWMLIGFYIAIAFLALALWGINAPVSILTVGFVAILPSLLMGARYILPVIVNLIIVILAGHLVHEQITATSTIRLIPVPSTYWDIILYATILIIFSLTAWVAGYQREKSLQRALAAESALKEQKNILRLKLQEESASLRLAQLAQIQQLYKFATLGQSTAATLHELSNQLSMLNLDIDSLRHQAGSNAIKDAKECIGHINRMILDARQQFESYDHKKPFNAIKVIQDSANDLNYKFRRHDIKLLLTASRVQRPFNTIGSPLALTQIVTILLNNAFDACRNTADPKVIVEIEHKKAGLYVSIRDNGTGIDPRVMDQLFSPVKSSKATGLGVGLFIAQNLTKEHFQGSIIFKRAQQGAHFIISLPKKAPLNN